MAREGGKTLLEARGDVQEAIDCANLYAGFARTYGGQTLASELPDKLALTFRKPLGVCGLITPWNFPIAIPSWKAFPALLCGNTVVLKPAEDSPACASAFGRILMAAGIPPGVFNIVHGRGKVAGVALVEHPRVAAISFTGSTTTGSVLAGQCGVRLKRCSLEMGGKNGQIVMPDADLPLALEGAVWGAFATAGQRCTATSRLLLHESIHDAFLAQFIAAARKAPDRRGTRSERTHRSARWSTPRNSSASNPTSPSGGRKAPKWNWAATRPKARHTPMASSSIPRSSAASTRNRGSPRKKSSAPSAR